MKFNILGAGLAGLSAAISLAKLGFSVDVFEQTNTIGGHIGNNIQAMRGYGSDAKIVERFKKEGLEINHIHPISEITKYSPAGKAETIYSNKEPIFFSFKRGVEHDSLENQLADQARKLGVNIILGKKARVVDTNVIAGGSKFDPVGAGYGALFEGNFDPTKIIFFLANENFKHGYGYLAPYGKKQATVAITSFEETDFLHLERNFDNFLETNKVIRPILENATLLNRFSGCGHFNIPDTAVHKYKYFVGGAAGFVDPARGFGVKYAILSGIFAAKSITSKIDYDSLWKSEFSQELVDGFNRRNLLNRLSLDDYEKFIEERRIPIESYEKLPPSFKQMLANLNGSMRLSQWKKKFRYADIFGL